MFKNDSIHCEQDEQRKMMLLLTAATFQRNPRIRGGCNSIQLFPFY